MRRSAWIVAAVVGLASCGRDPVGRTYPGKGAVEQDYQGWAVVGTFGNAWPATLRKVEEGQGSISFTRKDGSRHAYPGFDGYRMKALFFENASGAETVLVLRSRDKE